MGLTTPWFGNVILGVVDLAATAAELRALLAAAMESGGRGRQVDDPQDDVAEPGRCQAHRKAPPNPRLIITEN